MSPATDNRRKATAFRDLHHDGILVLPCAWDCASARIFEVAGFPAIGTTSSGIAQSQGYPDHEHIPVHDVINTIKRITNCVEIPVSADFEAGYGESHDTILSNIESVIETGAVGINLEDGTGPRANPLTDLQDQTRLISAIRELSDSMDYPLVVNGRTDVYLRTNCDPNDLFVRAVKRVNAYLDAGADCGFIPGVTDHDVINDLADAVKGPLNILAGHHETPSIPVLRDLGVARVSVGGGVMRAAMGRVQNVARELQDEGTFSYLEGGISSGEMQRLFQV